MYHNITNVNGYFSIQIGRVLTTNVPYYYEFSRLFLNTDGACTDNKCTCAAGYIEEIGVLGIPACRPRKFIIVKSERIGTP